MNIKQWRRRLSAVLFPPLVWGLIQVIWKTCRIRDVLQREHLNAVIESDQAFIPCYWHQQQLFCVRLLLDVRTTSKKLNLGYLISPSADGNIATRMFANQGVHIIRGSATRGGAQALREIYTAIRQQNVSPIITPDGPTGPIFQCKPGVAMIAHLGQAPIVPLAYAASNYWQLRSWDRFVIPRPFSTIVVGVGPVVNVTQADAKDGYARVCGEIEERLQSISEHCQQVVNKGKS
ncbi:MAG: lysophospholipid acyltransferase family protein [Granulosicoccus sp.]|nr:lysophospholipid acyltransferase family protein [Granulosicoccus sp.]